MDDSTTFPVSLKRCIKCDESKPHEMFAKNRVNKDGLQTYCKPCHRGYRQANLERARASEKAYHEAHREARNESSRAYYWANHDRETARQLRRREQEGWRERDSKRAVAYYWDHYEKVRESRRHRGWYAPSPDKQKAKDHRRRARIAGIGGHFTGQDIAHMHVIQQGHCCYCGRLGQRLTLEHIIPVTRERSSNDPWNLCLACRKCNSSKNNRLLSEWTDRWYLRT